MRQKHLSRLSNKKRYLQVAFNSTLEDAQEIINILPPSDRIIIEAGTPLIKRYGMEAIRYLSAAWSMRMGGIFAGENVTPNVDALKKLGAFGAIANQLITANQRARQNVILNLQKSRGYVDPVLLRGDTRPYIVADMKTIDRGATEVAMCAAAGASGVIAMGSAPIETLNAFIAACNDHGVDAMIDMMNIEFPVGVLRSLKKPPRVVVLHRGVDEERDNRAKMLPLAEIRRTKGAYDSLIAVAGGDTPREVQSAAFNDADIVVIWKSVYENTGDTMALINDFLKTIK